MFIPATFKQDNLAEIATFIRSHSLATLITPNGEVAHIPMILQTKENGELVLVGYCFKLSQNKDAATKQSICQNLRQINSPQAYTMAELIERYTNNA
ncbi:Putative FMN-binding domain [[Pasteurella] aerogenes]|nr:Putative FMN-binding domain [[Pasteurella] aerogenes]